ncbi:hypothetical protein [Hyphomicrobium sp. 2TAF46]|uniref:hypothetical protein n=1 Tax=Hyphomicrobium sp. 2TAF46 TaxID=3233019 RepID=UPI003F93F7D1
MSGTGERTNLLVFFREHKRAWQRLPSTLSGRHPTIPKRDATKRVVRKIQVAMDVSLGHMIDDGALTAKSRPPIVRENSNCAAPIA